LFDKVIILENHCFIDENKWAGGLDDLTTVDILLGCLLIQPFKEILND
jgi:hypothetical protein